MLLLNILVCLLLLLFVVAVVFGAAGKTRKADADLGKKASVARGTGVPELFTTEDLVDPVWIFIPDDRCTGGAGLDARDCLYNYQLLNISLVLRFYSRTNPIVLVGKQNFQRYLRRCYPVNKQEDAFVEDFIKYKLLQAYGGTWVHIDTILLGRLPVDPAGRLWVRGRYRGLDVPDDRVLTSARPSRTQDGGDGGFGLDALEKINEFLDNHLKHTVVRGSYGRGLGVKRLLRKWSPGRVAWEGRGSNTSFLLEELFGERSVNEDPVPEGTTSFVNIYGMEDRGLYNYEWFFRIDHHTLLYKSYLVCYIYRTAFGIGDGRHQASKITFDLVQWHKIAELWKEFRSS